MKSSPEAASYSSATQYLKTGWHSGYACGVGGGLGGDGGLGGSGGLGGGGRAVPMTCSAQMWMFGSESPPLGTPVICTSTKRPTPEQAPCTDCVLAAGLVKFAQGVASGYTSALLQPVVRLDVSVTYTFTGPVRPWQQLERVHSCTSVMT